MFPCIRLLVLLPLLLLAAAPPAAGIELPADKSFSAWQEDRRGWSVASDVSVDKEHDDRLAANPGEGILVAAGGETSANLVSREEFQDVELELEFLIPRGTNSGVKLNGLYEIQIRDTYGVTKLTGDDSGGIYPRADLGPPYKLLDAGVPPSENAALPAGKWQTLRLKFRSPRFDAAGKKTADARFLTVVLNGREIHRDVAVSAPTGAAWIKNPEVPRGPLLLQGDHGPVAFRNIKVQRLD